MKLKNIEEMSAEQLREKFYKFYYFLQEQLEEDAVFGRDNSLQVIIEVLNHVEDDHECAKIAVGMYSDLTTELGKENIRLLKENIELKRLL
jgi:hypothetical protein